MFYRKGRFLTRCLSLRSTHVFILSETILFAMFQIECSTTLFTSANVLSDLRPIIAELVKSFGKCIDVIFCPFYVRWTNGLEIDWPTMILTYPRPVSRSNHWLLLKASSMILRRRHHLLLPSVDCRFAVDELGWSIYHNNEYNIVERFEEFLQKAEESKRDLRHLCWYSRSERRMASRLSWVRSFHLFGNARRRFFRFFFFPVFSVVHESNWHRLEKMQFH